MRAHAEVIAQLTELVERDPRIDAAWLEGSHATGEADAWSDIDLHVAVGDEEFGELTTDAELRKLAAAVAPILGARRMALGPDVALLNATLAGPIRLDLYVERRSATEQMPRLTEPRVLFERAGLDFRIDPAAARPPVPAQLASLLERYGYGFMWPGRLLGRDDATTGLMNATFIVQEFLVPALLARHRPDEMHRELLSNTRFLPPAQRARVTELVDALAAGYLRRHDDEGRAFTAAQLAVAESILTELHGACAEHGVAWPDDAEHEIRTFLRATMAS